MSLSKHLTNNVRICGVMEIENFNLTTEYSDEGKRARRRQLAQQAVALAMQSRWQEAAETNSRIIELMSTDAEAHNRLGKAYTELGRIAEARSAYQQAVEADPANLIAQRNLDRLSRINESEAAEIARKATQKLDPTFFMEETGKTGLTVLLDVGDGAVLATLTAGDKISLAQRDGHLVATTTEGVYIGRVEARLAARLVRLMSSGNQYEAGVVGVDREAVRVIIRETLQSPENIGKILFAPRLSADALPRPYLREGLLRRASMDADEEDEDLDVDLEAVDVDDDEDDSSEFNFSEGGIDDR